MNDRFYTDTLFAKVKSLSGKTCMQVFCNVDFVIHSCNGVKVIQDVGIPTDLVSDLSGKQTGKWSDFTREANRLSIRQRGTEAMLH